jgi:hypothetical protein
VANRRVSRDDLLNEAIDWCGNAPVELFEINNNDDNDSLAIDELGSFTDLLYTKGVMLECQEF